MSDEDRYKYHGDSEAVSDPANSAVAIVPNDNADLAMIPKAIYTGAGGDISMIGDADAVAVTWTDVPAGSILPFRPRRVMEATTATGLLALY